jgi:hypothetical protein
MALGAPVPFEVTTVDDPVATDSLTAQRRCSEQLAYPPVTHAESLSSRGDTQIHDITLPQAEVLSTTALACSLG